MFFFFINAIEVLKCKISYEKKPRSFKNVNPFPLSPLKVSLGTILLREQVSTAGFNFTVCLQVYKLEETSVKINKFLVLFVAVKVMSTNAK